MSQNPAGSLTDRYTDEVEHLYVELSKLESIELFAFQISEIVNEQLSLIIFLPYQFYIICF